MIRAGLLTSGRPGERKEIGHFAKRAFRWLAGLNAAIQTGIQKIPRREVEVQQATEPPEWKRATGLKH